MFCHEGFMDIIVLWSFCQQKNKDHPEAVQDDPTSGCNSTSLLTIRAVSCYMQTMRLHRAPQPPGGPQTASSASYFIICWRIKSTCIYLHVLHAFIMHLFAKHVSVRGVIRLKSWWFLPDYPTKKRLWNHLWTELSRGKWRLPTGLTGWLTAHLPLKWWE